MAKGDGGAKPRISRSGGMAPPGQLTGKPADPGTQRSATKPKTGDNKGQISKSGGMTPSAGGGTLGGQPTGV